MNNSDKNNPRRLIRAIEVAQYHLQPVLQPNSKFQQTYIWLTASLDFIEAKIQARIEKRFQAGVLQEVQHLHETYGDRLCQHVKTTLGFEQLSKLLTGTISQDQATSEWQTAEKQYAQRQLTWWKAKNFVTFFSVDQNDNWLQQALKFASD